MVEDVEFGQVFDSSKKKQKGINLYPPKADCSITVRFVGSQQKIYQKWNRHTGNFSCSERKEDSDYIMRVVSFVIDRTDDKVKAFICPSSVYNKLGDFGPNHDFKITRYGNGLRTKYEVESLGESFISDEIEEKIAATSRTYPLSEIFIKNVKWELLEKEPEHITDRFDILDL